MSENNDMMDFEEVTNKKRLRKTKTNSNSPPPKIVKKNNSHHNSSEPINHQNNISASNVAQSSSLGDSQPKNPRGSSDSAKKLEITSKPKPIIAYAPLQAIINYLKNASSGIALKDISLTAMTKGDDKKITSIKCDSLDVKEKVTQVLVDHNVSAHSYTEAVNKVVVYVLKGLDLELNPNELLAELKDNQVPAKKVTTIVKSSECRKAVHLVHFAKDEVSIHQLNQQHRCISGIRVTWEVQKRSMKKPTQCHHCQRWGHSSLNCNHPARCVKCSENHASTDCKRPNKEALKVTQVPGAAKCVNCGGEHSANYAGCPEAKKYLAATKQSRPRPTIGVEKGRLPPRVADYNQQFPNALHQHPVKENSAQARLVKAANQPDTSTSSSSWNNIINNDKDQSQSLPVSFNLNSLLSTLFSNSDIWPLVIGVITKLPELLVDLRKTKNLDEKIIIFAASLSLTMSHKVIAWNCHSFNQHKKAELLNLLESNHHDIILLSETWLREEYSLQLDGYNCYRQDRARGGVALLINSKINHSHIKKISTNYAEAVSVTILDSNGKLTVSSIYCSPSCNRNEAKFFFNKVLSIPGRSIIAGDFNCKHQAWNNTKKCRKGEDLLKLCQQKNFSIFGPNEPTSIPPNGKPSAIDFVISRSVPNMTFPEVIDDLPSDHFPISFSILHTDEVPAMSKKFVFRKANWKKLTLFLKAACHQFSSNRLTYIPAKVSKPVLTTFQTPS